MTPRSRAKLGLDLQRTVDLATARPHPNPEVAQRMLDEALVEDDDAYGLNQP